MVLMEKILRQAAIVVIAPSPGWENLAVAADRSVTSFGISSPKGS